MLSGFSDEVRLPWADRHECLAVEIKCAAGLTHKGMRKPDTYVKIYVPSLVQNTIVKKTRVVKKTVDPEYDDSEAVWMDGQDSLYLEVWEKKVVGSDACLGRLHLAKSALPSGTSTIEGCWSPYVTMPLQSPKDRKTKLLVEPTRTSSAPISSTSPGSTMTMNHTGPSGSMVTVTTITTSGGSANGRTTPPIVSSPAPLLAREPPPLQSASTAEFLLESSSETTSVSATNAPRGSLTFRVNFETRHQEWKALAPLRGKFFVWGAVKSQITSELVLIPELVVGADELLANSSVRSLTMSSSSFTALCEDSKTLYFGMSRERIMRGENICILPPRLFNHLPSSNEKIANISRGMSHVVILTDEGRLYSTGINSRGELGQGTINEEPVFSMHRVVGLSGETMVGVCCGQRSSLAWTKDGKLFSWGDAPLLRMWTPETDWIDGPFDHLAHTDEAEAERENRDIAPVPKRVQGLEGVKVIRAWTNLTMSAALSDTGDLYTWGDHHCAGHDTKNLNVQYPQRIEVLSGRVAEAAVGTSFVIARDLDGNLWSWGCMFQKNDSPNVAYPLGRGGERSHHPVKIPGLPRISQITTLGNTCFAVDCDGQLWCWGESRYGECFKPNVTFGRPIRCEYFQDLKVELLARGFGTSMCVKTTSS